MKLTKITKLIDISKEEANRLAEAYSNEGYEVEVIPTYINKDSYIKIRPDEYELHVYKLIKRKKRWYTIDFNKSM